MEVRTLTKYVLIHGTFYEIDDELYHRRVSTMTTKSKKDFKYYAKVQNGKATRYFYTKEEWLAFKKNSSGNKFENAKPKLHVSVKNIIERLKAAMEKKAAKYIRDLNDTDTNSTVEESVEETPKEDTTQPTQPTQPIQPTPAEPSDETEGDWSKDLKHKDPTLTKEEDQAAVNPNYTGEYDDPYTNNCAYCTTAYDLRRRGYDVEAMPYDESITPPTNIAGISLLYENTTAEDWSRTTILDVDAPDSENEWEVNDRYSDSIRDIWTDSPDGSYGQLAVVWKTGGGHNMFWEKEDGEVIIRDCQTNEIFNLNEKAHEFSYLTNAVYAIRTDNRTPTQAITNYVRNKEGKKDERARS